MTKKKIGKEVRPTKWNGHKWCPSIITFRINFVASEYDALGFKLTGALWVCGGCSRSKAKARAVIKKTYTRASNLIERIFLDTTGPFLESFIRNRYCIGVVDNCKRYSWSFLTKTKLQLQNKMEEFFEKWRHVVHQLITYILKILESTNQNCRKCLKRILLWSIQHRTRLGWTASSKEY